MPLCMSRLPSMHLPVLCCMCIWWWMRMKYANMVRSAHRLEGLMAQQWQGVGVGVCWWWLRWWSNTMRVHTTCVHTTCRKCTCTAHAHGRQGAATTGCAGRGSSVAAAVTPAAETPMEVVCHAHAHAHAQAHAPTTNPPSTQSVVTQQKQQHAQPASRVCMPCTTPQGGQTGSCAKQNAEKQNADNADGGWSPQRMSFTQTNGGMPKKVARTAMRLQCYMANTPKAGVSVYAGRLEAPTAQRQLVGRRCDLVGVYVANELRTMVQHKALHMEEEQKMDEVGYSAELSGCVLDARHNPTGVALINEPGHVNGHVNVFMVHIDLATADNSTVTVCAYFLAEDVRDHDELRIDYGCGYKLIRTFKGYGSDAAPPDMVARPPFFTKAEHEALPDMLLSSYSPTELDAILTFGGVWDEEREAQVRGVGEHRRVAHRAGLTATTTATAAATTTSATTTSAAAEQGRVEGEEEDMQHRQQAST